MLALIHSWWTAALLIVFIAIVLWAYSAGRRADFEEAARLALDDDDVEAARGRDRRHG